VEEFYNNEKIGTKNVFFFSFPFMQLSFLTTK
jgi:hypothetical protein